MITEIISQIEKAEEQSEKLLVDARKKIKVMEAENQKKIDALRAKSEKDVIKKISALREESEKASSGDMDSVDIKVAKAKSDSAKKYIVDGFKKRYLP